VVWVFDVKTRRGKSLALPGVQFANDVAARGNVLYVSDNRGDLLFRVEPADFLDGAEPKVTVVAQGRKLNRTASIRPRTACSSRSASWLPISRAGSTRSALPAR
jgi:hypothetical protein